MTSLTSLLWRHVPLYYDVTNPSELLTTFFTAVSQTAAKKYECPVRGGYDVRGGYVPESECHERLARSNQRAPRERYRVYGTHVVYMVRTCVWGSVSFNPHHVSFNPHHVVLQSTSRGPSIHTTWRRMPRVSSGGVVMVSDVMVGGGSWCHGQTASYVFDVVGG